MSKVSERVKRGRPRRMFEDQIGDILKKAGVHSGHNRRVCMKRVMDVKEAKVDFGDVNQLNQMEASDFSNQRSNNLKDFFKRFTAVKEQVKQCCNNYNELKRNKRHLGDKIKLTKASRANRTKHNDTKRSKVIKCSHNPKIPNQEHETTLNHPFYKNTEKFDQLLGEQYLFNRQNADAKTSETNYLDKEADEMKTYMNIRDKVELTKTTTMPNQFFNYNIVKGNRKLLQVSEERGDTADVIDDKAVLTDDGAEFNYYEPELTRDDLTDDENKYADDESDISDIIGQLTDDEEQLENQGGIVKRSNNEANEEPGQNPSRNEASQTSNDDKYNPLDTIIKRAALQNIYNLIQLGSTDVVDSNNEEDLNDAKAEMEHGVGEMDNADDANNRYNKVVKMSQAYSDYGVLDEKKGGEKFGKKENLRSKMSANKDGGIKDYIKKFLPDRSKKPKTKILSKEKHLDHVTEKKITNNEESTTNKILEQANDNNAKISFKRRKLTSYVDSEHVNELVSEKIDNTSYIRNEINLVFFNSMHKTRNLLSIDANNTEPFENVTDCNITDIVNRTAMENSTTGLVTTDEAKVVKRDINSDNFAFWDDLYDEEYGVKPDTFDDNEFKTVDTINFEKKTNWFEDKVKRLKTAFKGKDKDELIESKIRHNLKPFHIRHGARIRRDSNNEGKVSGINFKEQANIMKKVMHDAIMAVQKVRNSEVRENRSSDEKVASSLMDQLISLMTDLVDYRVHQKTCRQLPPDLQEFLTWLTASDIETSTAPIFIITEPNDFSNYNVEDAWTVKDLHQTEEVNDPMSSYVKSLHAVENLLRDYNKLSAKDKKKMIGVKTYLENQLSFLRDIIYNGELS